MRLVNYRIDKEGKYHDCTPHIITINKRIRLRKDFSIINDTLIDVIYADRQYIGIEDVRIFNAIETDTIQFIGTAYHINNSIGVVCGEYDSNRNCNRLQANEIKPAFNLNSECEKNWVYVSYKGETHVIYSWLPLKICKINTETRLLELVEEKTMPSIFKHVRGSTCGFRYQNELWFIVHLVSYESPRHYYHMLVIFDDTMNLLQYSAPFKFEGECIEYCLGLIVENDRVIMTYSTWDRTTKIGVYSKKYIDELTIYY